ncbi:MAG TPA: hypothetical protein VJT74_17600 [Pyrinomonadaceae bacterium]|nr:hypothetical protein [Pyrinomonadaceae bacterium]
MEPGEAAEAIVLGAVAALLMVNGFFSLFTLPLLKCAKNFAGGRKVRVIIRGRSASVLVFSGRFLRAPTSSRLFVKFTLTRRHQWLK